MKIVQLVDHHSENMGYSDVCLSKNIAGLSQEVFVISSTLRANYNQKNYDKVYGQFHSEFNPIEKFKFINGYKLYRLKYIKTPFGFYLKGLFTLLKKIQPDVVQVGEANSFLVFQAFIYNFFIRYVLTVECHIHLSVFMPAKKFNTYIFAHYLKYQMRKIQSKIYKILVKKIFSKKIKMCYAISQDSHHIAIKYLGFEKKNTKIFSLGTDLNIFKPDLEIAENLRFELGFKENDIICIYTGRLDDQKKPHLLSEAILKLQQMGLNHVKGLFIGGGDINYIEKLKNSNTVVLPLVNYRELPKYYSISDIGVWPKQESTSQLDGLASGLPLILNDKVGTPERVDKCGYLYKDDSVADLAEKIKLLLNEEIRSKFSREAVIKAKQCYSWKEIAIKYLKEYERLIEIEYNKNL